MESAHHLSKSIHSTQSPDKDREPSFLRVFCDKHPQELVTNFCCGIDCLKALCPECIDIHNKFHRQNQLFPEIDSLKNVKRNCSKKIKAGINVLTQELEKLELKYLVNPQDVIDDGIEQIRRSKEKIIQMVNTFYEGFEADYKRSLNDYVFKGQDFNTLFEKIRNFINELEYFLAHLESNQALTIIRKVCLLDLKTLIDKYKLEIQGLIEVKMNKNVEIITNDNKIRTLEAELRKIIRLQQNSLPDYVSQFSYKPVSSVRSKLNESLPEVISEKKSHQPHQAFTDPDFLLSVPDYFESKNPNKFLHFFQSDSKSLYVLNLEEVSQQATLHFKQIQLNIPFSIPRFHKSLITPKGHIYLLGGSIPDQNRKVGNIYYYDWKAKDLKTVGNLIFPRSSHSVCYSNDSIFVVGGFLEKQDFSSCCEIFDLKKERTYQIASLNIPSAVSGICSFNDQFIFKFGGLTEGLSVNNTIERYDIAMNVWEAIDAKFDMHDPLRIDLKTFSLLSSCCCVQINKNEIFVFGGYRANNESSNMSFILSSESDERNEIDYTIKWINYKPLIEAEGFWNNTPVIVYKKVWALQNVSNERNDDCLENERRVVCFNSYVWKNY